MGRKNRNARNMSSTCTDHGADPVALSLEYDTKKGRVTSKPVILVEDKQPEKAPLNWKIHLAIFLAGLVGGMLMMFAMCNPAWPSEPPRIGKLVMPQEYWEYTLKAANDHHIKPYIIQGVMAIESGYDPVCTSGRGRCIGLMQLDKGVARSLGVDPWDPRENIQGGAAILARLLSKHKGNLRAAIREYNGTGNQAYMKEVLRAIAQAKRGME